MNVFVRRSADSLRLSNGFYFSDNVVDVLLMEVTLTSLPQLIRPDVTFALASNVLRLESSLTRMIIECKYLAFRNQSDIVFDSGTKTNKHSPFSLQQIQFRGSLAIIADQCSLGGYGLIKLSGQTVNLGHDTLSIRNCKFSVEISSIRLGTPPVIAPYFTPEQADELQKLLTKPVREEMLPKLQSTVFTVLNTSVIFDSYLPKFRKYQDNLFKTADKYVSDVVRNINSETVDAGQVAIRMPTVRKYCKIICEEGSCAHHVTIDNVTVYGLDSLYSSHTGGPFKLQTTKIAESLRFNSLTIRGTLRHENNTVEAEYDFVAEIQDLPVNFEINADKTDPTFDVLKWRYLSVSIIPSEYYLRDPRAASSYVQAYLFNKLTILLKDHLNEMYKNSQHNKVTQTTDEVKCITEKKELSS
nr:uncharacterized protein LOC116770468 [Danaus plexippus plexippus]